MKLVTIKSDGSTSAAVVIPRGYVRLDVLNEEKRSAWPTDLKEFVSGAELARFQCWYSAGGKVVLENLSRKFIVAAKDAQVVGDVFETED